MPFTSVNTLAAEDAIYILAPKQYRCTLQDFTENLKFRILRRIVKKKFPRVGDKYRRGETAHDRT